MKDEERGWIMTRDPGFNPHGYKWEYIDACGEILTVIHQDEPSRYQWMNRRFMSLQAAQAAAREKTHYLGLPR